MCVWIDGTDLGGVSVDGWNMSRCVWMGGTCLGVFVDGCNMSRCVCGWVEHVYVCV